MKFQHPVFPEVVRDVPGETAPKWLAAGWLPLEPVPDPAPAPCPTCGAEGDDPCLTFHTNLPTQRHATRV